MAEVDTSLTAPSSAGYSRADPLASANEVLGRPIGSLNDSAKKLALTDAQNAARALSALTNPTPTQLETLSKLQHLISSLSVATPAAKASDPKTWQASGATRARAASAPAGAATSRTTGTTPARAPSAATATPTEPLKLDASTGTATVSTPMTLKALAANAYGITEAQVGETHLALLAQSNPTLAALKPGEQIAAGTTVSLDASPRVAEQQLKSVTKGLENLDTVLKEARAAEPGSPKALTDDQVTVLGQTRAGLVEQGKRLKEQLPLLRTYDAVGKSEALRNAAIDAYGAGDVAKGASQVAGARNELDQALSAKDLSPAAKGILLKRRGELSILEANASTQPEAITKYREKNGGKRVKDLAELPAEVRDATNKALGAVTDSFKKAKADLQASAAQYREQAAKSTSPDEKKRFTEVATQLDGEVAGLAAREQSVLGGVHASVGHSTGQLESIRKELDAVLGPGSAALMKGAQKKDITSDGSAASVFSYFGSTEVGFMNRYELQGFKNQLAKFSPDTQAKALAVVAKYGEAGAATGDVTAINTSRQVLEARASEDPKGPWASQAETTKGNYFLQLGNPRKAAEAFREAGTKAATIGDAATKKNAIANAIMGEAAAWSAATREGNAEEKSSAADSLRALRQRVERQNPPVLDKSSLAQLTMTELNGFLGPNRSLEAEASLKHLKDTYGGVGKDGKPEVKWLSDSLKDFEAKNREGGAKAFAQVMMSEMAGRQTWGERLAFLGASTALGAGIGATGLGFGAIPGAIVGLAAGGIGLVGGNAIEGFDHAKQAAQTGLARQTWVETLTDGVGIAGDVLALGAVGKGLQAVGSVGLRTAAGAVDQAAMDLVGSNMLRLQARMGAEQFSKLAPELQEKAARQLVLKEMSAVSLAYGGAAVPAASLAAAGAGVAKSWLDIENSSMSASEKVNAQKQLFSGLGRALVTSLPQMALQAALHRSATSGLPGDLRKALGGAATLKSKEVELDENAFAAKLKSAAEDEIKVKKLTGAEADAVRAHYAGIAKNGEGFIELGTGNIYINKNTSNKVEVRRHERAHRDFHQLSLRERTKLVEAFKKDPSNKAIRDAVMAENPHGGGFTDLQIIDEYQAMVRAKPGAANGLKGVSPTFDKALEAAKLKGVKDGNPDLAVFRPKSGQRLAMGASGIDDAAPKKWGSDDFDYANEHPAWEMNSNGKVSTMTDALEPGAIRALNEAYNAVAAKKGTGPLASITERNDLLNLVSEKGYATFAAGKKLTEAQVRKMVGSDASVDQAFDGLTTKGPSLDRLKETLKMRGLSPDQLAALPATLKAYDTARPALREAALDRIDGILLGGGDAKHITASLEQLQSKAQPLMARTLIAKKLEPRGERALYGAILDTSVDAKDVTRVMQDSMLIDMLNRYGNNQSILVGIADSMTAGTSMSDIAGSVAAARAIFGDGQFGGSVIGSWSAFEREMGEAGIPIAVRDGLGQLGMNRLGALAQHPGNWLADLGAVAQPLGAMGHAGMDASQIINRLALAARAKTAGLDVPLSGAADFEKKVVDALRTKLVEMARSGSSAVAVTDALVKFTGPGKPLPAGLTVRSIVDAASGSAQTTLRTALAGWN